MLLLSCALTVGVSCRDNVSVCSCVTHVLRMCCLQVDPTQGLPSDLVERAQQFFSTLMWYCVTVLTSLDKSLPAQLQLGLSAEKCVHAQHGRH